jgi:hypothetical protein
VVINELGASNHSRIADEDGDFEDWIELHNPSALAVPLAGYGLTDDPTTTGKWIFVDATIPGNGFLLVWASNKDRRTNPAYLHTNFRLEEKGEFLGLYDPAGNAADTLTFGPQVRDASFGRAPDGSATWLFFATPTPRASNLTPSAPGFAAEPVLAPAAGVYHSQVTVQMSCPTTGSEIRYTIGGADVTAGSPLYSIPLTFTTHTVVRAQAYAPPLFPSPVVAKTFLIDVNTSMPILSVVSDPLNIFGSEPRAIYYANYTGDTGERPASVEYWENGGARAFELTCGLRIRGGASQSRDDIHKKSFQLHFRRIRGPAALEYPIIPATPVDKFDKIVLRANYNDSWCHWSDVQRVNSTNLRDEITRQLRLEAGEFAVHGAWCMLFLNGRQWGTYNITEKVGQETLENYFDHPDWDVIGLDNSVDDGDLTAWNSLFTWLATHDLSVDANYREVERMVDLGNFTRYMLINVWGYNTDWPHHNGYVARPRVLDGKWIAIDWDAEDGAGGGPNANVLTLDMMGRATDAQWRISDLLRRLLMNPDYRIFFLQQFDVLVNSVLRPGHMNGRLYAEAALIRPGIAFEGRMPGLYRGSGGNPPTYQYDPPTWEAALVRMAGWVRQRTPYVRQHLKNWYSEIQGWRGVTIQPAQGGEGEVWVHSIRPEGYPWSGTFFEGIPVVLRAVPRPGYLFAEWSDATLPASPTVSVVLNATMPTTYTVFARFAPEMSPPAVRSVEFVARNRLVVEFTKPVRPASAETVANYTVDQNVGAPGSARQLTTSTVLLTFSRNLSAGVAYELSAVNVEPEIGNPIPAGSPSRGSASFTIPPVAINEIMYNTEGADVEWIELHNTTSSPQNVTGWNLSDDEVYPSAAEGNWSIPQSVIPAHGYLVVGLDRDMTEWRFPAGIPFVQAIINRGGSLNNGGDNIALYTAPASGLLIDGSLTAAYPDLAPAGSSLEKEDQEFPWRGHPAAWKACTARLAWSTPLARFATPGAANSTQPWAAANWPLY